MAPDMAPVTQQKNRPRKRVGALARAIALFQNALQRQSTRKECPMRYARCEGTEADHAEEEDCKAARCEEEFEGAHDRFPGPNAAH